MIYRASQLKPITANPTGSIRVVPVIEGEATIILLDSECCPIYALRFIDTDSERIINSFDIIKRKMGTYIEDDDIRIMIYKYESAEAYLINRKHIFQQ